MLKVGSVLEGSVRKAGDRVRITAQLIRATDDRRLWSETYDRNLKDVFAVEGEIAAAIAKTLQVKIVARKTGEPDRGVTRDQEAFDLYLRGRHSMIFLRFHEYERAATYFEEAVGRDPNYVQAWAALAEAYCTLGYRSVRPAEEAFPKCKFAAMKALDLDETNAEAHTSWALFKMMFEHDWSGAEREAKRALELNPHYARAWQVYAQIITSQGRVREALAPLQRAQELDPLSLEYTIRIAWHYYLLKQPDRAIEQCHKALEIDPTFKDGEWMLAWAYSQKRMFQEAIAASERAVQNDDAPQLLGMLAYHYAENGQTRRAREILDRLLELRAAPPLAVARVFTVLGEKDRAFEWLEKAYEQHAFMEILKVPRSGTHCGPTRDI